MKNLFISFGIVFQILNSQSIDSSFNYFPLQIGNMWSYDVTSMFVGRGHQYYYNNTIIGDTLLSDGTRYFIFVRNEYPGINNLIPYMRSYIRVDTASSILKVFSAKDSSESNIDSLASQRGDYFGPFMCSNIRFDTILGYPTTVKDFTSGYSYGYGLGFVEGNYVDLNDLYMFELVYAKIGDKIYGTPLSVNKSISLPDDITLSQNYPNPFNPNTTIHYALKRSEFVTLSVFNILGEEINRLISETKPAGNYSVDFNGENLPSGVYYYVIRTSTCVITKAMLLIK